MLIYDPAGRISAKQALHHEYFLTDEGEQYTPEPNPAKVFR
jgi:hypothetical protein